MNDGTVALVTNGSYGVGREIVRSLDATGRGSRPSRPGHRRLLLVPGALAGPAAILAA